PVIGLRGAWVVAFISSAALVDCGRSVLTDELEPPNYADPGVRPGSGGAVGAGCAVGAGGASSQLGCAKSQFASPESQLGGGSGFVDASGGRQGFAGASSGGLSGGVADGSAGSSSTDGGRCDCPFGYKCVFSPPVTQCVNQCPDNAPDLCGSECRNFKTDV